MKLTERQIVHVIAFGSERCPRFYTERGEPCDGLEGCDRCLSLVAKAIFEEGSE